MPGSFIFVLDGYKGGSSICRLACDILNAVGRSSVGAVSRELPIGAAVEGIPSRAPKESIMLDDPGRMKLGAWKQQKNRWRRPRK